MALGVQFDFEKVTGLLKRIYALESDPDSDIDIEVWEEFRKVYYEAIDQGFGVKDERDLDYFFYRELRENVDVFAAFKTHRMQTDLVERLLDENGDLKSFHQFEQDTKDIVDHQCRHWLKTEYDTAILRAQQAADWRNFERYKDILPNLKWMPTTSVNQDFHHREYWSIGLTLPIVHDFWNWHRPGDRWNCKCSLKQTDEPVTSNDIVSTLPVLTPDKGLDNRVDKDGKIFSDTHPYIETADKKAKKAVKKFIADNTDHTRYKETKFKGGGLIRIAEGVKQGSSEAKKNLKALKELAKYYNARYELLGIDNTPGHKNPDCLNLDNGYLCDIKVPTSDNGKNAIQASIKAASKQKVSEVYIYLEKDYKGEDIRRGLLDAFQQGRASSIHTVIIREASGEIKKINADQVRKAIKKHRR